jgi:hypothetical protein
MRLLPWLRWWGSGGGASLGFSSRVSSYLDDAPSNAWETLCMYMKGWTVCVVPPSGSVNMDWGRVVALVLATTSFHDVGQYRPYLHNHNALLLVVGNNVKLGWSTPGNRQHVINSCWSASRRRHTMQRTLLVNCLWPGSSIMIWISTKIIVLKENTKSRPIPKKITSSIFCAKSLAYH